MVVDTRLMTVEEFESLPPSAELEELLRGKVVRMPPPGNRHGSIVMAIGHFFYHAVKLPGLGTVVIGSGVILARNPDTVLAPDLSVFLGRVVSAGDEPPGYLEESPTIVVEVVSPSDTQAIVREKVLTYLEFGVELVVTVEPSRRTLTLHGQGGTSQTLEVGDVWNGSGLIDGLRLPIADIFA